MARNVEIKARVESIDAIIPVARALADKGPVEIIQDDTFFPCQNGRLKLRLTSAHEGQLIFYRRRNEKGPKESFYLISHTTSPDTLRDSLSMAYGQLGRVRKKRLLYLVGRTRVHLDRVEDLGSFLELEVVLEDGEDVQIGEDIAQDLMQKLAVLPEQLVDCAYIDMLLAQDS
jgi:predicted adenylyl cyclase CyaB